MTSPLYMWCQWSLRGAALRVSTLGVTVGAKASYKDFTFTIGGAVVRNQTFVRFGGEGT